MIYRMAFALLSALVATFDAIAEPSTDFHTLSRSTTWHYLVGYEADTKTDSGFSSEIKSDDFFLSPSGRIDPYEELLATVEAFRLSSGQEISQCRYPGRYAWLSQVLNLQSLGIEKAICQEYLDWSSQGRANISLMYATGYFKNPASYYGHIFIRVSEPKRYVSQSDVLNTPTLNFGARIPEGDGMIKYIVNGIFGGYTGRFTTAPYYKNLQTYVENDFRDVWEYALNFGPQEKSIVLGHLWELLNAEYTYYFTKRNCVYRIAEALDIHKLERYKNNKKAWLAPQELLFLLGKQENLVGDVTYYPSRQSQLYGAYTDLSEEQKLFTKDFVDEQVGFDAPLFSEAEDVSKASILDALLSYYQYKASRDDIAAHSIARNNLALKQRFFVHSNKKAISPPAPPHSSRPISYVYTGRDAEDSYYLGIRPAYYDILDAQAGHTAFATLTMAEMQFAVREGEVVLKQLNAVDIQSTERPSTRLPGDRSYSWEFNVRSYNDVYSEYEQRYELRAGVGKSWYYFNEKLALTGLMAFGIDTHHGSEKDGYLGYKLRLASRLSSKTTLAAVVTQSYVPDLDRSLEHKIGITVRQELNKHIDLRLGYQRYADEEAVLQVGYYW